MLFDTDILIWVERGNLAAAELIERAAERCVSIQTYMELLQGAADRHRQQLARDFLHAFDFELLPLSENIGHRAAVYIEEYALANGLRTGDAIIAATAVEADLPLASGNAKHFQPIASLDFRPFDPDSN